MELLQRCNHLLFLVVEMEAIIRAKAARISREVHSHFSVAPASDGHDATPRLQTVLDSKSCQNPLTITNPDASNFLQRVAELWILTIRQIQEFMILLHNI